jgi:Primase C terminal 1 (PriCT-1)
MLLAKLGAPIGARGNSAVASTDWRDLVCEGVGEGRRNETLTRLAGYLLRRRVDPIVALEMLSIWNTARCRPPLEAAEIRAIVDSIAARELQRRGGS